MAVGADEFQTKAVGPYLLQKTLGKGQTGLVKLGVHCSTGKTVAVKIINREKLSKSVLLKVEREIAIMKLIDHPHVLRLHDVYENNMHLYLILEHVSGGELFDYLVRKGRLSEREARRFFKQIASAVDFCHKHSVCHRDLKPENLLLDTDKNIKVADFGMASLQVTGTLLETSCGSPHYACPEVIRGENYDGRRADVWSLGVILFALLVGSLPFDDDNLRVLLEKVKRGRFNIPAYVPSGAQELIKGMVDVNPKTRLTLDKVMTHPWLKTGALDGILEPVLPMGDVVSTCPLESREEIDPDVFGSMTSLGCFRDKHKLIDALLSPIHNEEKIIYFLLLDRKEKRPSIEDDAKISMGNSQKDPPRKRVDSHVNLPPSFQLQRARSHSIGSASLDATPPRPPRLSTVTTPNYTPSSSGYYSYYSPQPPSKTSRQASIGSSGNHPLSSQQHLDTTTTSTSSTLPPNTVLDNSGSASPWKRKISSTLKTFAVHSPRFGRKRYEGSPDASATPSPQTVKRSWFSSLKTDKEKEEVIQVFREMNLTKLKESLMRSFTVVNIQSKLVSENMFKCKYERSVQAETQGKTVLKKKVKFMTTILPVQTNSTTGGASASADQVSNVYDGKTYSITFKKLSGPTSRFSRVCDKLHDAIANPDKLDINMKPISGEFTDHDNPSGSSDDTLTIGSRNGGTSDLTSRQSSSVSIEIVDHDELPSPNAGHPSLLHDDSSGSEDGLVNT